MWEQIRNECLKVHGKLYEVILMDPPWRIEQKLSYHTLSDQEILNLPIEKVQARGVIIIWIVNQKKDIAREFLRRHQYKEVDKGEWIMLTNKWSLYCGWGYYEIHCNETFIIGTKNDISDIVQLHKAKSVFFDTVGKHSEKPHKIYEFIQKFAPDKLNLETFARKHSIRENWDFFGNEIE